MPGVAVKMWSGSDIFRLYCPHKILSRLFFLKYPKDYLLMVTQY
jgi:hypothetical protein